MQQLQQHLQNYQQQRESQEPPPKREISKAAWYVWKNMAEIYGNLWLSNFGEKPNKNWDDMLTALSPEQVKYGVALCKNIPDMPKSIGQFRQLCKSMPDPNRFEPALPAPKVDRSKVRGLLDNLPTANVLADMRKKREQEERAKAQIWRQLHDPDYQQTFNEKKAAALENVRNKLKMHEVEVDDNFMPKDVAGN